MGEIDEVREAAEGGSLMLPLLAMVLAAGAGIWLYISPGGAPVPPGALEMGNCGIAVVPEKDWSVMRDDRMSNACIEAGSSKSRPIQQILVIQDPSDFVGVTAFRVSVVMADLPPINEGNRREITDDIAKAHTDDQITAKADSSEIVMVDGLKSIRIRMLFQQAGGDVVGTIHVIPGKGRVFLTAAICPSETCDAKAEVFTRMQESFRVTQRPSRLQLLRS